MLFKPALKSAAARMRRRMQKKGRWPLLGAAVGCFISVFVAQAVVNNNDDRPEPPKAKALRIEQGRLRALIVNFDSATGWKPKTPEALNLDGKAIAFNGLAQITSDQDRKSRDQIKAYLNKYLAANTNNAESNKIASTTIAIHPEIASAFASITSQKQEELKTEIKRTYNDVYANDKGQELLLILAGGTVSGAAAEYLLIFLSLVARPRKYEEGFDPSFQP